MTTRRTADPREPDPATTRRREIWTADRIRALGAVTDVTTAASIFGLSRAVAYDLARHDRFPVPVIRVGSRYRVPVAAILTALQMPAQAPPAAGDLIARRRRAWIVSRKSAAATRSTAPRRPPEEPTS